jgi:hypothetical protein
MPQLDVYMFAGQSLFIFVFILGYLLFVRYVLPIISFEIKVKELLPLYYLSWLEEKQKSIKGSPYSWIELGILNKLKVILKGFSPYLRYVKINHTGVYYNDLLYLRSKYKKKVTGVKF